MVNALVSLQVTPDSPHSASARSGKVGGHGYRGPMTRIVLVEDDPTISEPLTRALGREGYDVEWHGTGLGGVDAADSADLLILDLGLPDIDGVDVARRVRDKGLLVPILMLTARADEVDLVVGLDAGADDYVTKPFRLAELLARVRALLDRAGNRAPIEVDGGIDLTTVESVVKAGAEWLVAGHAIFSGGHAEQAARALKDKAEAAAGK